MTRYQLFVFVNIVALSSIIVSVNSQNIEPKSVPYQWKSVQMVGGGFVDGIVYHPHEKGLVYCRTDMGGAYRWNVADNQWEPILDWVPYEDTNLMGVESIALDPSDPNKVYLSCGTYTNANTPNGAVLRSDDRGKTFKRTNMPFKMGGNENGRGNGERMAVDPRAGNIIYLGTRDNGLWRSSDYGATWNQVETFPNAVEPLPDLTGMDGRERWMAMSNRGCGVVFVIFDRAGNNSGKGSSTIYAGASLMGKENLFVSTDAGKIWKAVPGQPVQFRPTHAILSADRNMYITYGNNPGPASMTNGSVWKYNTQSGTWTDITPDKPDPDNKKAFGYAAVSVDAQHPQTVIVSSYNRYLNGGDDIFRSIDAGKTWKPVFGGGGKFDYSKAPYVEPTGIHWLFDIEIDPFNSDHAIFTTGYGGHETFDLTDVDKNKPTTWSVMSKGIEETVALELLSPPKGSHLITAVGDYGGFVHNDLDKPAPEGNFRNPHFGNTNGVACGENNPSVIVRVGQGSHQVGGGNIGYSLDGGKSWQPTTSAPAKESMLGTIAVSTDGKTWIWSPSRQPVYYTSDNGNSWTPCKGIPNETRVIADPANPRKFYAMSLFDGKLFVSVDGGDTFTEQTLVLPGGLPKKAGNRGDNRGGQDRIYATPGQSGNLWIAAFDGLYNSSDTGNTFTKLGGVHEIHAFGFGKAAPGANYPALYLVGVVNGLRGIFRSDDEAKTWVRINDDQHQWGLILHVTGDPKQYGRVYVGTHGRGTFYADPVEVKK